MIEITLPEWSTYPGPDSKDHPIPPSVIGDDPRVRAMMTHLAGVGLIDITEYASGLVITSNSHVGRITLGSLQITIQPKLNGMPLLKLLRYAYGLRNINRTVRSDFSLDNLTIQDLLIYQLLIEAEKLITRGLRREYVRYQRDLSMPRGRVDIGSIAARGGVMEATLPCIYHDRNENILLNQVLAAGLREACLLTSLVDLRSWGERLRRSLNTEISLFHLDRHVFASARRVLNRLTRVYEPVLNLIELLHNRHGISLDDAEKTLPLPGFLLDMNRFFQTLLSRFLRENLTGEHTLRDEHALNGVMIYDPLRNPLNRRAPTPRPDFAVLRKGSLTAVLDAKYRDLWSTDLPREWLYQLAIYALSQPTQRSTILYPTLSQGATESHIVVREPISFSVSARVILRPVDMLRLTELIEQVDSYQTIAMNDRSVYAGYLVGFVVGMNT